MLDQHGCRFGGPKYGEPFFKPPKQAKLTSLCAISPRNQLLNHQKKPAMEKSSGLLRVQGRVNKQQASGEVHLTMQYGAP